MRKTLVTNGKGSSYIRQKKKKNPHKKTKRFAYKSTIKPLQGKNLKKKKRGYGKAILRPFEWAVEFQNFRGSVGREVMTLEFYTCLSFVCEVNRNIFSAT